MEQNGSLQDGNIIFLINSFDRFENLENGKYGRDYLVMLAK